MRQVSPASAVLVVRPTSFNFDQETARSNAFQHKPSIPLKDVRQRVNKEFDAVIDALRSCQIDVTVFEDTPEPEKPDAVFPNNWLSTWPDGHIFLYPMATESRRIERSVNALNLIKESYNVTKITDLSKKENDGTYLESTGVMIFDHTAKIAYGCISLRCDSELFRNHCQTLGYRPVLFHAYDINSVAIYHTNVLMGVQTSTAVVCLDAIRDLKERNEVIHSLESTEHTIITISQEQMTSFCGNVLELQNKQGQRFLFLSQTAYNAFTPLQRSQLSRDKTLVAVAIPTIETIGGGSIRCMLAELFLPPR